MKTKIIYISGSEVFDMADVRAAFNEVRNALNLQSDTVLFGVPVDADDAGLQIGTQTTTYTDDIIPTEPIDLSEFESDTEITDTVAPAPADTVVEPVHKPKKTSTRKTRAKVTEPDIIVPAEPQDTAAAEPENIDDDEPAPKIIPILSVLASKPQSDTPIVKPEIDNIEAESIAVETSVPDIIVTEIEHKITYDDANVIESVTVDQVTISDDDFEPEIIHTQSVTMVDMITDDAPVDEQEKTLEQLLENMAPLREDRFMDDFDDDATEMNSDATLAQLASEFVEEQDNIISTPRAEASGKIGKLKNILPFKKAKREDTGLMGDLFGWAGIAANDEEFSMPGFFTTTASKK